MPLLSGYLNHSDQTSHVANVPMVANTIAKRLSSELPIHPPDGCTDAQLIPLIQYTAVSISGIHHVPIVIVMLPSLVVILRLINGRVFVAATLQVI